MEAAGLMTIISAVESQLFGLIATGLNSPDNLESGQEKSDMSIDEPR